MTNRFDSGAKRSFVRAPVLRVLVLLLSLAAFASAQPDPDEPESLTNPKTEAAAFDIARHTMSPFCPGRTLADCPSDKAAIWRQDIRRMLTEGKSAAEIRRILNERAGVNLTGAPESSIGWVLPVGLVVGALGVLALVIVRFRKDEPDETASEASRGRGGSTNDEDDGADDDEDEDEDEKDEKDEDEDGSESDEGDRELEARLRRELEDEDEDA